MPNQLADIMVYSPDGQAQLAVEVKAVRDADDDWANEFRRNLLDENLIPRVIYFLIVLREHLYLWLPNSPIEQESANYKAATKDVLGRFMEADKLKSISGQGLEFIVSSWLNAMAASVVTKEDAPELDWRWILACMIASEAARSSWSTKFDCVRRDQLCS